MKLTKNVWRTKKVDHIKDEQHRKSLDTFGAIIEHRNEVLFFPLDNDEEEKQLENAVAEIGLNCFDRDFEREIYEKFDNEDINEHEDSYKYTVDGKEFKRFNETNSVYFWNGNAYNAVVWENNGHWICFDEKFDDIDLYQENVIDTLKNYITDEKFASTFGDMFDQFAQDRSGMSPACGFDFENDFPYDEVELITTVEE